MLTAALDHRRRPVPLGERLIGTGAALFTLVSGFGFNAVLGTDVNLDPSRIAAQIVSGVGFLGAGVIFIFGIGLECRSLNRALVVIILETPKVADRKTSRRWP